ncbi:hypothetical protein L1987_38281 [Smallanthus sonchifolius]|uniref:Uncharacterized protein n=1 Tax=Smallanthus sonchifolius TaxID=185202 RepID=A0ACB9HK48_9ASTR|nr:hypothetical protein L1987_38281 [Smallanthus sonchifolius]
MEPARELSKALIKNTNNPKLAWQIFKRIAFNPTFPSDAFNQSLPVLTRILIGDKMFTEINTLQQLLLTHQPQTPDHPMALLMRVLAKLGHVNLAVSQLQVVGPETYTFNLLIGGLCDSGCLEDARKVFDKMRERGYVPNEFSFGILVRGYCRAGRASEGKTSEAEKLVEMLREDGHVPNVVTFDARISALCSTGKVLEASRIFRDMQVGRVLGLPQPDVITYNLMLEGFCKEGMMEEAKTVIESMKEIGVILKVESYNIWLMGLVRNGMLLEAQVVLNEMVEKGVQPTIVSNNILMDGLCKNGMLRDAKTVMSLMRNGGVAPDVVSYSILLHGYCKKGMIGESNKHLHNMIANGCFPNEYTCNSLLESLWKEEKESEAEELLKKMKERGYALNTVTYNIVLDGLCKMGQVDKAVETMHEMWNRENVDGNDNDSCKPDLITYSTIISALCKDGKLDEAKKKFIEMIGRNVYPDSVIYDIFIYNLCKKGKVSSVFRVLKEMEKKGYNKSLQTYNSLILGLGMKSQFFEMYGLMNEMRESGISPNVSTYNNMIRCLCESGQTDDATKLLDEMLNKGVSPNISTFKLLIKPLCQIGEFRPAQEVFNISLSIFGHKETLYSFMFNELAAGDELLEAKDIFMSALDRCFDIANFSYGDFINRLCKAEMVECATEVLKKMIKKRYTFEPASFMPVIDGLRITGNKHEADEFAELMLEMGSEIKVTNQVNRNTKMFNRRKVVNNNENKWQNVLHRDDGSGATLKILNKIQKGWSHERISNIQSPNCGYHKKNPIWLLKTQLGYRGCKTRFPGNVEGKGVFFRISGFKEMEKKLYNLCLQIYNSLILGLGVKSRFFEMYGLMNEMGERGISPNVSTYNNMLRRLCESGQTDYATKLLDEMLNKGNKRKAGDFAELMLEMGSDSKVSNQVNRSTKVFNRRKVVKNNENNWQNILHRCTDQTFIVSKNFQYGSSKSTQLGYEGCKTRFPGMNTISMQSLKLLVTKYEG